MQVAQEIETLIRARYPIIYIVSPEETRVQAVVAAIGGRQQKRVFEWSCTQGLVNAGTSIQVAKHRTSASKDPLVALDQVIDHVEPAIFLFKDLHPHLTKASTAVIRKLKEIAHHLKNSYKTIILVSPVVEIPAELEKEITLLNFPLPGPEEFGELLDKVAHEVRQYSQVRIDFDEPGRSRLLRAALGLTLAEAENVLAKIIVKEESLTGAHVFEVFAEKQQIIRKSGLLEYCPSSETFGEIGGLEVLKDWLAKRAVAFSDEARAYGLPAPRGMLLLGVQGCGKSLCAKAVSSQWELPLLRFDMGRMFGSFVGSSEENVRRAIAVAESVAPAILWVDEIDKAFAGTQSSGHSDGGTSARVFGTFLTWLSEKSAPVFVVATANDISNLPPELMRKGRLDEMFFVDLPSSEAREEIFRIHLRRRGRDDGMFDVVQLAAASEHFSGAEIEQAIISALYDAFAEGQEVHDRHILQSIAQSVPLATTMSEHIETLRAWAAGRTRNAGGTP